MAKKGEEVRKVINKPASFRAEEKPKKRTIDFRKFERVKESKEISKDTEESEEVSELEEEVKTPKSFSGEFDDSSFLEILKNLKSDSSPVLERITRAPETPLFGWASSESDDANNKVRNNESFRYEGASSQQSNKSDEKKYIDGGAHVTIQPQRIDSTQIRRRPNDFAREISLDSFSEMQSRGLSSKEENKYEGYEMPPRADTEQAGRKNPFEREDKKYDPRLPKH